MTILIEMPVWRMNPEPVLVNCHKILQLTNHDEYIVQFTCQRGNFTAFVEKRHVDRDRMGLHAAIYADVRGKGYLVRLPEETLNSGPQILVYESEKDEVLTFHDWTANNDS